jgi:hypothetical protein
MFEAMLECLFVATRHLYLCQASRLTSTSDGVRFGRVNTHGCTGVKMSARVCLTSIDQSPANRWHACRWFVARVVYDHRGRRGRRFWVNCQRPATVEVYLCLYRLSSLSTAKYKDWLTWRVFLWWRVTQVGFGRRFPGSSEGKKTAIVVINCSIILGETDRTAGRDRVRWTPWKRVSTQSTRLSRIALAVLSSRPFWCPRMAVSSCPTAC